MFQWRVLPVAKKQAHPHAHYPCQACALDRVGEKRTRDSLRPALQHAKTKLCDADVAEACAEGPPIRQDSTNSVRDRCPAIACVILASDHGYS